MSDRLRQPFPQTSSMSRVPYDPDAAGCILAVIDAKNRRVLVSTRDVHIPEIPGGTPMHFAGVLLDSPSLKERVDPFNRQWHTQSVRLRVMGDYLPLDQMRRAGVVLQNMEVDLYWHVVGRDMSLSESMHLLHGKVIEPMYDAVKKVAEIRVADHRLANDNQEPFPPVIATTDLLTGTVDSEAMGKAYPMVFGAVKKLPIFKIDEVAGPDYRFLVMLDQYTEFSGAPVSAVYEGDATGPPTINAQARATDTDSNGYWYVDLDADPTNKDVTADVTGHTPATPDEVLRYLLNYMGRFSGRDRQTLIYDANEIQVVKNAMSQVTMGFAVNERVRNGAMDIVQRVCSLLPITMVQRGRRYTAVPMLWDRDPVMHLRTDDNLIRRAGPITETTRRDVYNEFTVKYQRSGLRGDFGGCIVRDWGTDQQCAESADKYGRRAFPDVDAGDLADLTSATWLMNWLVETYSKVRVYASYDCHVEAGTLRPWRTVRLFDLDEGWDHGPLFKVSGITRRDGPVRLDLVSIDDVSEVYGLRY